MINGTGDGGSSLAVGLGGLDDSQDQAFIDFAKKSRGWLDSNLGPLEPENFAADGALASLPSGQTTAAFFFSSRQDGNGIFASPPPDLSGRYRLSFTGSATVTFVNAGTNVTQIDPSTYEFDCDFINNKWLTFTPSAYPIKVTLVKTTDLAAHGAGEIFRSEFLNHVPANACLRFMDWMGTNNSPVVNAADYPTQSNQYWGRVPMSVIVELCNQKTADPWINIPHAASDALVTEWATYLKDNLHSGALIRVELSNEIWNTGIFTQGSYFKAQAETFWGVPDGFGGGGYWLDYAGKRFTQIITIFRNVFVGQENRICGVIGGQAANPGLTVRMLDAPGWEDFESQNYVPPRTFAKEWSIADYIGWGSDSTAQGNTIKAALDVSYANAVQAIKDQFAPGLALSKSYIDTHVLICAERGLRLTTYEYNNHFDLNGVSGSALYSGGSPVPNALEAFFEATFSQEMVDAQNELRDYFKSQNGSLKAFFVDLSRATRFGTWGAKTHIAHNSPIWNALLAWHAANPRWYSQ